MISNFSKLGLNISEKQYRQLPHLSYSMLAKYAREGFDGYLHINDDEESESLTFGSVLDCLITEPKLFDERFKVVDCKVTGKIKDVLDYLLDKHYEDASDDISSVTQQEYIEAFSDCDFYPNLKLETKLLKFQNDDAKLYYTTKQRARGKQVITAEIFDDATSTANALKYDRYIGKFFADYTKDPYMESIYQLKLQAKIDNCIYKCMIDLLLIDHSKKMIFPVDLKSSSKPEYDFPKSFSYWRYDLQARLYWAILNAIVMHSKDFCDYTIADYTFIVINKKSLNPLAWTFKHTKDYGDIVIGDKTYESPFSIAKQLNALIENNAKMPLNIKKNKPNVLEDFI